jgi:hypothetical protein
LEYAESRGLEARVYDAFIDKFPLINKIRPMQSVGKVSSKVATKLQGYINAATKFLEKVPK